MFAECQRFDFYAETTCPMDFLDISNGRVSASDSARVG